METRTVRDRQIQDLGNESLDARSHGLNYRLPCFDVPRKCDSANANFVNLTQSRRAAEKMDATNLCGSAALRLCVSFIYHAASRATAACRVCLSFKRDLTAIRGRPFGRGGPKAKPSENGAILTAPATVGRQVQFLYSISHSKRSSTRSNRHRRLAFLQIARWS